MKFRRYHLVKILFWVTIAVTYILAVIPQQDTPKLTPLNDKGNHVLAFLVLTLLLLWAYRMRYLTTFAFMVLYGIFIELSQLFTHDRSGELLDVVADSVGVVGGILIYWLWIKFLSK
jgi:VanZ family protein